MEETSHSSARRRLLAGAAAAILFALGPTAALAQSGPTLIYGGSDAFPPYEYVDAAGRPQGVYVDLIHALARVAGRRIEVRLGPWDRMRREGEAGRFDLMTMAYTAERARTFAFLDETATVRLAVLFPEGRASYPTSLAELRPERVAVAQGEMIHDLLLELPEATRPVILAVRNNPTAIEMLQSGRADAIAGNALVLRTALAKLGVNDVQEVVVKVVPHRLVTRLGREAEMAWIAPALAQLRESGEYSRIIETHLAEPAAPRSARDYALLAAAFLAALGILIGVGLVWSRFLRAQVAARTRQIEEAAAERERGHAEQALRDSEERYRAFVELSNDGIWRFEFDAPWPAGLTLEEQTRHMLDHAYVAEANDAMARLYGLERADQLVGRKFQEIRKLRGVVSNLNNMKGFVASGFQPTSWETHWIDEHGVSRWSISNLVGVARDGALLRIWATQHDITERKHAEEELHTALSLVRATLESTADGIVVQSNDLRIVDLNERFSEMWRLTEEMSAASTRTLRMVADHVGAQLRDPDNYVERVREILSFPGGQSYDVLHLKDGRVFERHSRPQRVDDAVVGRVWSFRDVTEHEQSLREIQEANRLLEVKNAELERFTYTVSHDLKSPLITIRAYLAQLEASAVAGNLERFRADAARIQRATDKMEELLRDLLALSRVGRVRNPDEDVSLGAVAQDAADLVRGALTARGVTVTIAPDLPTIRGDRQRILEVMQNLIENATKFMGEQAEPRIEIGVRPAPSGPVFFVRDNGLGIEPRHHDKVFDLFEKLTAGTEGTGVGLALVKRIIEAHGGHIWVESEGAGRGSTFCFTLPVAGAA